MKILLDLARHFVVRIEFADSEDSVTGDPIYRISIDSSNCACFFGDIEVEGEIEAALREIETQVAIAVREA